MNSDITINEKLADISRIMANPIFFLKVRDYVNDWKNMAMNGNEDAQRAMKMIDQFHHLCSLAEDIHRLGSLAEEKNKKSQNYNL